MHIHKIDNTTFGYNKSLNRRLVKKLDNETNQDYITNSIRNLNTFCNDTENALDACDETKDDSILLLNTLIPAKLALISLIDYKYPEMNFIEHERASYGTQAAKLIHTDLSAPVPWQAVMENELYNTIRLSEIADLTPEQNETLKEVENKNIASKYEKIDDTSSKTSEMPEVIERFEPNEFSPKGFESLGGMKELKEELFDKIIFPATHPEEAKLDFIEYGKRAPRGIMLYGPPGCGKTSTVQALSQEAQLPLFMLKISKAGSKYINETSNNYQKAFDYAAECAQITGAPCFMMIDEIDGISKGRSDNASSEDLKQISTLLNLIETARDRNIIVIGATNKYDIIDDAIKRRFDSQIYVGMPDVETREQILNKTLSQWQKGLALADKADDLHEIATRLNGFPSSAIVILADKASTRARKDGRRPIAKEDFFEEIKNNENLKIKADNYQTKSERPKIGYKN